MFKNTTYTDFRTAYKHIIIPRYVVRVIPPQALYMKRNTGLKCVKRLVGSEHKRLGRHRLLVEL